MKRLLSSMFACILTLTGPSLAVLTEDSVNVVSVRCCAIDSDLDEVYWDFWIQNDYYQNHLVRVWIDGVVVFTYNLIYYEPDFYVTDNTIVEHKEQHLVQCGIYEMVPTPDPETGLIKLEWLLRSSDSRYVSCPGH